ncbi:thioredoxin [Clostridioides mangenotii]|uniref:thioredoxin n=1 Tax=Metaclostridioides mangenotii TaxID=1540 RepID=UPI001C113BBF|nr:MULTISPECIES: thioredoxin [Clostridioides]MBS5787331.1 thioredoxin [Clostridioides difficile]MBU5306297.1 thioredoxin [Clostridioides mangenotii]MCR1954469.1 thioredoxin [Clostridioides mangenotii]
MAKVINTSEFRNQVEDGKGVVVVDFFATWCGPCNMLGPVFEELGEEMKEEAKFLKLDIDQSLEIAQQFNVSTVPTMMVFKDGKAVDTMVGFMPKDKIELKVKSHL